MSKIYLRELIEITCQTFKFGKKLHTLERRDITSGKGIPSHIHNLKVLYITIEDTFSILDIPLFLHLLGKDRINLSCYICGRRRRKVLGCVIVIITTGSKSSHGSQKRHKSEYLFHKNTYLDLNI